MHLSQNAFLVLERHYADELAWQEETTARIVEWRDLVTPVDPTEQEQADEYQLEQLAEHASRQIVDKSSLPHPLERLT